MLKNQKGFLLISIIFIMLLMAVSIFSINYYSTTQIRIASNHAGSIQTSYDLNAIVEESVWKLTDNLFWRTVDTGENFPGNNVPNAVPKDSVTDATTNGTKTITKAGENFLETCIVNDTVFIWDGTSPEDYGVYFIETITDNENLVLDRAPSGSNADVDFDVFRTSYTRIVRNSNMLPFNYPSDYADAVTISIRPLGQPADKLPDEPGYIRPFQRSFRYYATVFAGNGWAGSSGDGGSATSARLNQPRGLFVDSSGNLFIADKDNHKIRKVDAVSGNITTVAGNGWAGSSGDGGAATSAELNYPRGVFVDSSGNLFIADAGNSKIRKVNTSGIITTVAGKSSHGYDSDGSQATSSKLYEPNGICVDSSGNFYIADTLNHRIRKVDTAGIITTIAGTWTSGSSGDGGAATSAELNYPRGVFLDSLNNIYIADSDNHKVRKVNATTGIITRVAGTGSDSGVLGDGGPATSAKLLTPLDVCVDHNDNIFIVDWDSHRIRVVNAADNKIYTLAGTGSSGDTTDNPAVLAKFDHMGGIAMASGYGGSRIFISDTGNHKIKVLEFKTVYGL